MASDKRIVKAYDCGLWGQSGQYFYKSRFVLSDGRHETVLVVFSPEMTYR